MENSLAVQWSGLCAFTAEGVGSTPAQGAKILQDKRQKKKKKSPPCGLLGQVDEISQGKTFGEIIMACSTDTYQ